MEDLHKDLGDDSSPLIEQDKVPPEEYIEKTRYCGCCTPKCLIIFLGLIVLFDWVIEVMFSGDLVDNEYYDPIYMQVYLGLLGIYAVSLGLFLAYLVSTDGPCSRCLVPFAVLIAALVNFAIVTLIFVYIYHYYKYDKV